MHLGWKSTLGFGSKLKAFRDMGISPNEIRKKFDIPNQFFLNGSQPLDNIFNNPVEDLSDIIDEVFSTKHEDE